MPSRLVVDYQQVRRTTEDLCRPLETEDYGLQATPDASPTKWHLAHVSWFFETFLLKRLLTGYKPFRREFEVLFNSYYNAVGPQWYRPHRGHLSRPTVEETFAYRAHVDEGMVRLLEQLEERELAHAAPVVVLGMNHEQQHQELLLTDIQYNLSVNPLRPAYHHRRPPTGGSAPPLTWVEHQGGVVPMGYQGKGFFFDNEARGTRRWCVPLR
jgi:ergothioneine biosynthesis protein EgtB